MQESIALLVRVQCRRKESLRSLSHLLMSFLLVIANGVTAIFVTRPVNKTIPASHVIGTHSINCRVVTSGHVIKMAVSPFDPPSPKNPMIHEKLMVMANRSFTLRE